MSTMDFLPMVAVGSSFGAENQWRGCDAVGSIVAAPASTAPGTLMELLKLAPGYHHQHDHQGLHDSSQAEAMAAPPTQATASTADSTAPAPPQQAAVYTSGGMAMPSDSVVAGTTTTSTSDRFTTSTASTTNFTAGGFSSALASGTTNCACSVVSDSLSVGEASATVGSPVSDHPHSAVDDDHGPVPPKAPGVPAPPATKRPRLLSGESLLSAPEGSCVTTTSCSATTIVPVPSSVAPSAASSSSASQRQRSSAPRYHGHHLTVPSANALIAHAAQLGLLIRARSCTGKPLKGAAKSKASAKAGAAMLAAAEAGVLVQAMSNGEGLVAVAAGDGDSSMPRLLHLAPGICITPAIRNAILAAATAGGVQAGIRLLDTAAAAAAAGDGCGSAPPSPPLQGMAAPGRGHTSSAAGRRSSLDLAGPDAGNRLSVIEEGAEEGGGDHAHTDSDDASPSMREATTYSSMAMLHAASPPRPRTGSAASSSSSSTLLLPYAFTVGHEHLHQHGRTGGIPHNHSYHHRCGGVLAMVPPGYYHGLSVPSSVLMQACCTVAVAAAATAAAPDSRCGSTIAGCTLSNGGLPPAVLAPAAAAAGSGSTAASPARPRLRTFSVGNDADVATLIVSSAAAGVTLPVVARGSSRCGSKRPRGTGGSRCSSDTESLPSLPSHVHSTSASPLLELRMSPQPGNHDNSAGVAVQVVAARHPEPSSTAAAAVPTTSSHAHAHHEHHHVHRHRPSTSHDDRGTSTTTGTTTSKATAFTILSDDECLADATKIALYGQDTAPVASSPAAATGASSTAAVPTSTSCCVRLPLTHGYHNAPVAAYSLAAVADDPAARDHRQWTAYRLKHGDLLLHGYKRSGDYDHAHAHLSQQQQQQPLCLLRLAREPTLSGAGYDQYSLHLVVGSGSDDGKHDEHAQGYSTDTTPSPSSSQAHQGTLLLHQHLDWSDLVWSQEGVTIKHASSAITTTTTTNSGSNSSGINNPIARNSTPSTSTPATSSTTSYRLIGIQFQPHKR